VWTPIDRIVSNLYINEVSEFLFRVCIS